MEYRIYHNEIRAKIRPIDSLRVNSKSIVFGSSSWLYYSLYIYRLALGEEDGVKENLKYMLDMTRKAMDCDPASNLKRLEAIF